jgi:hypothetical protein
MADNTRLPIGTQDGDTYASDDIAGIKIQRVKITLGGDGTNDGDVASSNPMPITGTVTASGPITDTQLRASKVPVTADIAAAQTLATVTTLGTITNVVHIDDNAGSLTVDGTITTNELPDATAAYAPSNATSAAYESNRVIKGSAGVLFAITGFNSSTSDQFIQIHDSSSLPADTAIPSVMFLVRASRDFSLSFGGKFGRYFSAGIVICNSSTGPTKTIGSADCWFDAQYK